MDSYRKWEEGILKPLLEKRKERSGKFVTASSAEVDRLYVPSSPDHGSYAEKLGYPGQYPYTRGIQPTMYRGRLWTMRQYAGFGDAAETNARFKYLLEQGQTGLSVAFDLPTQVGLDSSHELARGEVGKVGVAIDTVEDMKMLFDSIPLDKVSTSMTINSSCAVVMAMYVVTAEEQGADPSGLAGTVQNDILKEYIARGTYIFPPRPSMRLVTDIFAWCSENMPKWNTISISGYHIREAGSTAAQEVGFTLADGIAYVEAAKAAGLDLEKVGGRLSFFFNAHNDLLEEVAKFRAARRMWAEIMKDRFGVKSPRAQMLRFHTQTAGCTLTARQPDNNIVRVAMQALAAVLGGTQSLHTNSRDEALSLPTEDSVAIALRTQQILAHDTGVANTIDPLAGSFCIENMTDSIENEAKAIIDKVDELGGMVAAIEKGYPQKEIQDSSYRYQMEIENNDRVIVGVNKFTVEENRTPRILKVDPEIGRRQVSRLDDVFAKRDAAKAEKILSGIREAAKGSENLMPLIFEAVRSRCSIGEICGVLRDVFGEHHEQVVL